MNFNKSTRTAKSAELSEYPTTPPKNKSSVFQNDESEKKNQITMYKIRIRTVCTSRSIVQSHFLTPMW